MSGGEQTREEAESLDRATGARPADAARRALRAARERDRYASGTATPDAPATPGDSAPVPESTPSEARTTRQTPARPGDVAREALRRAAESRTGGPQEPAPEREDAPPSAARASVASGFFWYGDGPDQG
ncbi:hypothetical protein PV725_40195, partial [Streptomyces scabiei]|nr:hypothetical protein [Streptomyces scabiei]